MLNIKTNISEEQMDYVREHSYERCPSTLKFLITINNIEYRALLTVVTLVLNAGFRKPNGERETPLYKKFNIIKVEDIKYNKSLFIKLENTLKINIDNFCYYCSIQNEYKLIGDKFYNSIKFIEY